VDRPHLHHHLAPPASTMVRDNRDPHASTTPYPTSYTSHQATDVLSHLPHHHIHVPTPPTPIPCLRAASHANQTGHVTASNHAQYTPAFNDDEREFAPANLTVKPNPVLAITYPNTPPYLAPRSHPPPWPNKNSNKNHKKYYYSKHTPADTIVKRRPPPWPIIPTPTSILSIKNSHPPPWPILLANHIRNHWNVRCRIRKRSYIFYYMISLTCYLTCTLLYPALLLSLPLIYSTHTHLFPVSVSSFAV
jgi:hypothetical protein